MTAEEIQAEIGEKRQLLRQTDYEVLKAVESFFTATSDATGIIDFLSALRASVTGFVSLFTDRASWRERINELEDLEPEDQ